MNTQILLKRFAYSIVSTGRVLSLVKRNQIVPEQLALMNVSIDFDKGKMKLKGYWNLMIESNRHSERHLFPNPALKVEVKASIYPSIAIDLNDPASNGLVFTLEGSIDHGNRIDSCPGLMVLEKAPANNGLQSNEWNIGLHLYNLQVDGCGMLLKFPIYLDQGDGTDN